MTTVAVTDGCAGDAYGRLPCHVRVVRDAAGLCAIGQDMLNLVVWSRKDDIPRIDADADAVDRVDDIGVERDIDRLPADLPGLLADAGYSSGSIAPLAVDIADLGRRLAAITAVDRVAIRLEVVETDACRRFHADYNTARLICTYAGPGTQWLDCDDAAELAAGADVATLTIRQIATGDVAVLKGRRWSADRPIIHRSPPIVATGEQRLLLVIDPVPGVAEHHQ